MPTFNTTPSTVSAGGLIQNLGPDALYITDGDDPENDGVRVEVDQAIAIGFANGVLTAVSDGESDVRILGRATGIFPTPTS
jgi:hypothetical protein